LFSPTNSQAAGTFKFGGKVIPGNDTFGGSKFGPVPSSLGDWDGNYTTYLKISDQQEIPIVNRGSVDYVKDSLRAKPSAVEQGEYATARTAETSETAQQSSVSASLANSGIIGEVGKQIKNYQKNNDKFLNNPDWEDEPLTPITLENLESLVDFRTDFDEEVSPVPPRPFLKYFIGDDASIRSRGQEADGTINARDLANAIPRDANGTRKKISYIRDPLNDDKFDPDKKVLPFYNALSTIEKDGRQDDAIVVSFAMGNDNHVQFRAFITDLTQSANPEYKPYQYIGRIEKFISYVTVQRTISFKLKVLAFSKDELQIVWERLNYLNSFVFPYGFDKGILQPNIIRATIGAVYKDHPMYITGMNINFSDYSWDIDNEVPIAADVDIQATLIEKNTAYANKGFFGWVERSEFDITTFPEDQ
jgi:hypothetical protein